jgi:hypothetical protein
VEVIDPGHTYHLRSLDLPIGERGFAMLKFVKREGPRYPGNRGHHSGTTTQEVLRALIERSEYVNGQIADPANVLVARHLRECIWLLEERAARRHGRKLPLSLSTINAGGVDRIETYPTCPKCNHIGCEGSCGER